MTDADAGNARATFVCYMDSNGKGANYYSNPNSGFYQPVSGGARMGDIICTALGLGCLVCLFRAALVEPEVAGGFKAFRKHMYKQAYTSIPGPGAFYNLSCLI